MNTPTALLILDLVLKSTALLILAFATQSIWRHASAAQRGFIWLATFAVLALLPLTPLFKPRVAWDLLPQKQPAVSVTALPEIKRAAAMPDVIPSEPQVIVKPHWRISVGETAAAIWLMGVLLVLVHRIIGIARLRLLKRRTQQIEDAAVKQRLADLAHEIAVKRPITLLQSDAVSVPITWGTIRPSLLMPTDALNWNRAQLDAALRHELGHVRHLDAAKRLFAQIVCAIHWFNPLVWLAAKSWRTAQELACDDLVLRAGSNAEGYAMQLLQAAKSLGSSTSLPSFALAMAKPSTLETRLTSIVDESRNRRPLSRAMKISGAASGLLMLTLCAAMQLRAADKSQPKPTDATSKDPRVQVYIMTKVIEAPIGTMRDIMGEVALAPGGSTVVSDTQLQGIVRKLSQKRGIDLKMTPSVTTASGQQAIVEVGKEIVIDSANPKDKLFVGIKLALKAEVGEGTIDLDVAASSSENSGTANGKPVIQSHTIDGKAKIKPGSTVILQTEASKNADGSKELVFLITASLAPSENNADAKPPAVTKPTTQLRAEAIILPKVEFQDASLDEALEFLRIKSKDLDPEKKGINIIVVKPKESGGASVSLELKDIPLIEALRYVAELSGLELRFDEHSAILEAPKKEQAAPKAAPAPAIAPERAKTAVMKRAEAIIFPKIEFQDATLFEALEFLRIKSKELDPEKKGINIIAVKSKAADDAKLTLSLSDVPLSVALRYIAELAGMQIKTDEHAYLLMPVAK